MSQEHPKSSPPTLVLIVVPIIVALIGLVGVVAPPIMERYFTLLSTPTVTIQPLPSPTLYSTPDPCPYQGQTDNETIVKLIKAEASASNFRDLSTILKIFSPNAVFYDYAPTPPEQWYGPDERYGKILFTTTEFKGVEHFDILAVGPGIDGNTAYYTSGSKGNYRIGNGSWMELSNGSIKTTQYGSEHWILEKNGNGCWMIIEMQFNAGDEKFP